MHDIETDLISAAALGRANLYGMVLKKMAALNLDAEDRLAIMDMLAESEKRAAFGMPEANPGLSSGAIRAIGIGSIIAAPVIGGVKMLMDSRAKDRGWEALSASMPEAAQNPGKIRAYYDLLHSASPNIAQNTPVAADLIRQMSAQPQIDLGTVGRLATIRKDMLAGSGDGPGGGLGLVQKGLDASKDTKGRLDTANLMATGKMGSAMVPATHIAADGTPCVLNWATPAIKAAGLTDLFTGSGTTMEQANQAQNLNGQMQQYPLLPLDAVVRELLMKEQELAQREEMIAMREQEMMAAQQTQGQAAGAYQNEYGVDTTTGQPLDQGQAPAAAGQDPNAAGPEQGQDPNAAGPEQGQDPNAAGPEQGQDPNAAVGQDPTAGQAPAAGQDPNAVPAQDPAAAGQDPNAAPEQDPNAAPEQDPAAAGQDPNAAPEQDPAAAAGQDPNAAPMQDPAAAPAAGLQMDPAAPGGALPTMNPDGSLGISIPLPTLRLSLKLAQDQAEVALNNFFRP